MTEKDLIKKLNNLKNTQPDSDWKNNYRQVLFSQISIGIKDNNGINKDEIKVENPKFEWKMLLGDLLPSGIITELSKPVWVIILMLTILSGGGIASIYASSDSKPGDSLYIAKIISEKAQMAVTFNEKEKAKLTVGFAANRAKEITQVLEEEGRDNGEKMEKVEKLAKDFKKEISEVKSRLSKISKNVVKDVGNIEDNKQPVGEDVAVFGANLGKDNQRIEISEPNTQNSGEKQELVSLGEGENNNTAITATSTTANNQNALKSPTAGTILEEAEKLFDEKNYNGTINKLSEVNTIIDQANESSDKQGEVQGVSEETASTTNK